jgi:tRNA pseudouridine55 synthase
LGDATRLIEYVQRMPKTYRALVRLGATSDTDDAEGTIVANPAAPPPSRAAIAEALRGQLGTIDQVPPRYSAVHVAGQRAYRLARRGEQVELTPRSVHVHNIDIIEYEYPLLDVEIACGSGTYIRSIARDVGHHLGCGALLQELRRTRIGAFCIDDALAVSSLDRDAIERALRPISLGVAGMPAITIEAADAARMRNGVALAYLEAEESNREIAVFDQHGLLVAIAEHDAERGRLCPKKVFAAVDANRAHC